MYFKYHCTVGGKWNNENKDDIENKDNNDLYGLHDNEGKTLVLFNRLPKTIDIYAGAEGKQNLYSLNPEPDPNSVRTVVQNKVIDGKQTTTEYKYIERLSDQKWQLVKYNLRSMHTIAIETLN